MEIPSKLLLIFKEPTTEAAARAVVERVDGAVFERHLDDVNAVSVVIPKGREGEFVSAFQQMGVDARRQRCLAPQ